MHFSGGPVACQNASKVGGKCGQIWCPDYSFSSRNAANEMTMMRPPLANKLSRVTPSCPGKPPPIVAPFGKAEKSTVYNEAPFKQPTVAPEKTFCLIFFLNTENI